MQVHMNARAVRSHLRAGEIRKTRMRRRLMQMMSDEKALPRSPTWIRTAWVVQTLVG